MNFRKIAAIGAAVVMAAGIVTGVPTNTGNVLPFAIVAEAADSKLAAPKNLKAAAGDGKVTLTWDKVKGADAYRVYLYNAETKKYEKCKLIKGEKATVTGLENGKTYKFKVAAAVKNGKSYKTGKASAAVSATPKAEKNAVMKELTANEKNLVGTWEFYDMYMVYDIDMPDDISKTIKHIKYDQGSSYDPSKVEYDGPDWIREISILNKNEAMVLMPWRSGADSIEIIEIKNTTFVTEGEGFKKYKVYSYGEDKFLFVQFIRMMDTDIVGEDTYIFKYAPVTKKS